MRWCGCLNIIGPQSSWGVELLKGHTFFGVDMALLKEMCY